MNDFFYEFFVRPIIDPTVQGYNIVNTLVYGALLLVIAFFVLFPLLEKMKIKFNERFAFALLGYIFIGISLRAINEFELIKGIHKTANVLEFSFYTFTPGVWFLVTAITLLGLFIAKILAKGNELKFSNYFTLIGLIIGLPLTIFVLMHYINWLGFFIALIAVICIIAITKIIFDLLLKKELMKNTLNLLVVSGQALDATASTIAIIFYGFSEQHPLSETIITLSPIAFIIVKIALILLIIYLIESEIKKENLKNFIKIVLFILGFATGGASLLKIGLS